MRVNRRVGQSCDYRNKNDRLAAIPNYLLADDLERLIGHSAFLQAYHAGTGADGLGIAP
jgi:hypothetical protein